MTTPGATTEPSAIARRWAWALNLLVLLPVLPMVLGRVIPVQHDIFISDLLHNQLPYKAFLGESLSDGHLPLWMPDVFSGIPYLASIQAAPLFPPHTLLYGLLDPYTALGLTVSLELVIAAVGAWLLARRLGAGHIPALLAGLAFAWSGFMVTHTRHLNMHASAALLPWLVLAMERLLASAGRRGGVALAVALGLTVLAGHPQILFIACLLLGLRYLAHALPRLRARPWGETAREAAVFAVATGIGLALGAVQLVPTWAYTAQSLGQVEPTWAYAAAYPCPPGDLLALAWPPLVGAMETWDYSSQQADTIAWGNYGYGGILTLALALAALVLLRRRRTVWFWASCLVLSLLLTLGPATPLYRMCWELVPGMKLFRFPTRFLMVAGLALALLGALGLQAVLARLRERVAPRLVLGIGALVVLASLLDLQHHQLPRLPMDDADAWASAGPPPELAGAVDTDQRVLVLQEFQLWESAFRKAKGHTGRPHPYRNAWTLPLGSSGVMTGLRSASGYARMVHWRSAASWQEYNRDILPHAERPDRPTPGSPQLSTAFQAQLDRASVTWLLSAFPIEGGRLERVGKSVLFAHRNLTALPRAYAVTHWHSVDSYERAAAWLQGEGAEQPALPVIEGAPQPADSAGGRLVPVPVQEHGPNRLQLDLPPGTPAGMLVLSDTWDAGWRAWIDDMPATVLVANGYQRAVQIPAGAGTVTLRYRPPGLGTGLGLSLGALVLLLGWAVVAWRRRGADGSEAGTAR